MYIIFLSVYINVDSISNFCELRPKWCVLTDYYGGHSVCVCTIHQNDVLLVDALDVQVFTNILCQSLVVQQKIQSACFIDVKNSPNARTHEKIL